MTTRKMLTTGATALVAVLAFGTDAYAFGKKRGNGCCGGGGYSAYSGCYGSGYGGSYAAYSGGCHGSGYGYSAGYGCGGGVAYGGAYSGGYASGVGSYTVPAAVMPAGAVVPAGYSTYQPGYGGFSSGYAPAVVPASFTVPYSTPYGVPAGGTYLNYGFTPTGRGGLFRR